VNLIYKSGYFNAFGIDGNNKLVDCRITVVIGLYYIGANGELEKI
jgi:hypothetical protein